ncbi:hypothetical protein KZ813_13300 [Sphingomonas sp. RHCKR7]|uniref:hypothetical protein n=1 Tax=Sphingomonas folli TaxID=2862497 RepID=UPI001CA58F8F|nr:hypothetical protein [Sphingomonas folli]MBW6527818.1 hypothetical protein [Sphingomonas folli]
MFVERAYVERERLSDRDLERLRACLVVQVQRYEYALPNYPTNWMEKHGRPFVDKLREKVARVDALIISRTTVR